MLLEYRLRIRTSDDSADALVVSSVRTDTNPYLAAPPRGDGSNFNPVTGDHLVGAYTGHIIDAITSGTDRVLTSLLEDAGYRQQLGMRKAFLEYRADGGSWTAMVAGLLVLLRLTDALTYEFTIQAPDRLEQQWTVFQPLPGETITDFLTRWPQRGCIMGGPIMGGGIGPVKDLGGWEMTIADNVSSTYRLTLKTGYGPPWYVPMRGAPNKYFEFLNDSVPSTNQSYISSYDGHTITDIDDAMALSNCPGTIVLLDDTKVCVPVSAWDYDVTGKNTGDASHGVGPLSDHGIFIHGPSLSVGTTYRVRVLTVLASEPCPVYWDGHPLDLLTKLWDEVGITWNAAAIETVRAQIGADVRIAIRVTAPQRLSDFLKSAVYGPFGVGVRSDANGDLEVFSMRVFPNTAPAATIGNDDVVQGGTTLPFELDQSTSLHRLTIEHTRLIPTTAAGASAQLGTKLPPDGFFVQSDTVHVDNADPGAFGSNEVTYSIPGMVHTADAWTLDVPRFVDALAYQLFDRAGRGLVRGVTQLLRGGAGDALALGDEALVNIAQLPNHNKRLGDDGAIPARRMQVTQLTEFPAYREVQFTDSGPNANPIATLPTLAIAASSDWPRTVAEATITNAAALNTAGYAVRLQMAVTTGAAPTAGQYVDVAYFEAGAVPTAAFALAPVTAGATVYIQARSELAGSQPSNYGTAAHVTLSAVDDPTAVTATPDAGDGSVCALSWTIGANAGLDVTDIWLRASGDPFSAAVRRETLSPGSTVYELEGLTPGASYTASVQHRDPVTQDVSDPVDVTFTAGATTIVLDAPVYPQPWSGAYAKEFGFPIPTGDYGMAVVAAELPGIVEIAEAVETAVGSGTYGSYDTVGQVPSVLGTWTMWGRVAPNDGLRRKLKARHIADGKTASAYTSEVVATPWTALALPAYPDQIFIEVTVLDPSPSTDGGTLLRIQVSGVDPAGGSPQVRITALSSNVTINTGPAVGTLSPNDQIWKLTLPDASTGPGNVTVEAVLGVKSAKTTIPVPSKSSVAIPQGSVLIDSGGFAHVQWDGPTEAVSYRYLTSTSAWPSEATTAASGNIVNGRQQDFAISPVLSLGQTIYITIVPFTGTGATGTQLTSIRLYGSFQTYARSKTQYFGAGSLLPDGDGGAGWAWKVASGLLQLTAIPANPPVLGQGFTCYVPVPAGCTLTNVSFNDNSPAAGGTTSFAVGRVSSAGAYTSLGSGSTTVGAGWQIISLNMSDTTGQRYEINVSFVNAGSVASVNDQFAGFYVTYTMPTSDKTL